MSACNQSWPSIVNKKKPATLNTPRWTFTFQLIIPFNTHGYWIDGNTLG